jgi:hypothetical protein
LAQVQTSARVSPWFPICRFYKNDRDAVGFGPGILSDALGHRPGHLEITVKVRVAALGVDRVVGCLCDILVLDIDAVISIDGLII